MNVEQELERLRRLRVRAEKSEVRASQHRDEVRELARALAADGTPAARIAEALGVSRARVYQVLGGVRQE